MKKRLMVLCCVLALLAAGVLPVGAEIVDDFPEVVLFATDSMDIGANSTVFSGDVVVNELTPQVELQIGNKVTFPAGTGPFWQVKADTLDVGTNVNFNGTVICNEGDALCAAGSLTAPVYGALPIFQSPGAGATPILVPPSTSAPPILPGDYGDVTVGLEGTITFQGPGVFNVGSFTSGRKAQINVLGEWAEIRVHGDMNTGVEDNINLNAGAPAASEVVFYVTGNATLGRKTTVNANFYVAGTLELESNFTGTGALLATDLVIGQKGSFTLATFWDFPPQAEDDGPVDAVEDASVEIDVLANDSDPDGDPIFVNAVTAGNGTIVCTGGTPFPCAVGDTLTYTPNADYFGADSFTYEICDVDTQINEDNCDTATVALSVTSVNDPPIAEDDSLGPLDEDTSYVFSIAGLLANDKAGPPGPPAEDATSTIAIQTLSGPANGHFDVPVSPPPAGNITYFPNPDFNGTDTFQYTICDNGDGVDDATVLCATGTVSITVTPVNDAPQANPQTVLTSGAGAVSITLTGFDVEGDSLIFSIVSGPDTAKGSLSNLTQDPPDSATVTYTPVTADDEPNEFTFQVDDNNGGTATAIVSINPDDGTPEPPVPGEVLGNDLTGDKAVEAASGQVPATRITLTGSAPCEVVTVPQDPEDPDDVVPCDGNGNDVPLTFFIDSGPTCGTAPCGTLTNLFQGTETPRRSATVDYTPPDGFTGDVSFVFRVEGDVNGDTSITPAPSDEVDTATVEITVEAFLPEPDVEAVDQRVATPPETPVVIDLAGSAGTCGVDEQGNVDPNCRVGTQAPLAGTVARSNGATRRPAASAAAEMPDPMGGGAMSGTSSPVAATRGPVTRAAAPGEDLFAIDSAVDELFELSTVTGAAGSVGSTAGTLTTPGGLAFDGTDMFTIDFADGELYKLDLSTGQPTLVGDNGIVGWQGLAWDPTGGGQLYGLDNITGSCTTTPCSGDLYTIDRDTGAAALVATGVGELIGGIEFDSSGQLWGTEFGTTTGATTPAALVKIDKATGVVTTVADEQAGFIGGFQGIDFSTDGTLYGQSTNSDALYIIDTATGALTLVGGNTTVFVKGLAFSDEVALQRQLSFAITTLPTGGQLAYQSGVDGQGAPVYTQILQANLPFTLPSGIAEDEGPAGGIATLVQYTPDAGTTGLLADSFVFEVSNGLSADLGLVSIDVLGILTGDCATSEAACDDGRPGGSAPIQGGGSAAEIDRMIGGWRFTIEVEGKGDVATSRRWHEAVSYMGVTCGSGAKCGGDFADGSTVVLYARPTEYDSEFVEWGGDCRGSDPVTVVTIWRQMACTAIFRSTADD